MKTLLALRVSLMCALAVLQVAPAAAEAASRLDVRAGYDTDPEGLPHQSSGDAWAALAVGDTRVRETGGPLSLSLDLALGVTAYARLTDLDRVFLVATPALDYVLTPAVAVRLALIVEGQVVSDGDQSAIAWGGNLRLRERLARSVDLAEYVSYRDQSARAAEYSGTKSAVGVFLRVFLGERWLVGAGAEYAHGDFFASDAQGLASSGMHAGTERSQNARQAAVPGVDGELVAEDEDRLTGALALYYTWSDTLSTGLEYTYAHVADSDGTDGQHGLAVSTTYSF